MKERGSTYNRNLAEIATKTLLYIFGIPALLFLICI